jgi:hypothetical protein
MSKQKQKSKVKRANQPTSKETESKYPFTIEASEDTPAIPTHTHGLTEIGWPEFFIDPFAFGARGNAARINRAYDYFSRPENIDALRSILQGQTVKVTGKDLGLQEDPRDLHTYCFREAPPTFEGVKLAYPTEKGVDLSQLGMRFVQIYVEGDEDFVLNDDYYKGGVKG